MYSHIKKGDLVSIPSKTGDSIYLVVCKRPENNFYCQCSFELLNEKGEVINFYANANNPYKDIRLLD